MNESGQPQWGAAACSPRFEAELRDAIAPRMAIKRRRLALLVPVRPPLVRLADQRAVGRVESGQISGFFRRLVRLADHLTVEGVEWTRFLGLVRPLVRLADPGVERQ